MVGTKAKDDKSLSLEDCITFFIVVVGIVLFDGGTFFETEGVFRDVDVAVVVVGAVEFTEGCSGGEETAESLGFGVVWCDLWCEGVGGGGHAD